MEIILFSIIRVQIKRNPGRSILTVCIAMCLLLFVGAYWENVIRMENALHTLSDSIPVGGSITDISGGKQTALEISTTTADKILESGYVKNVIYTGQAAGNLEEYNRVENPKVFDTTIVGSNSCDAFSALTEETISFFEKGEENFLSTDKPLCVVSEQYAREHQIKEGETLQFPLYAIEYKQGSSSVQYRETGMAELTVIGTVPERYLGDTVMDILVPVQWLRAYIEEADLRFSYSSMNFQVKNPMKLNAFKKAMENMGLQEKSQEAMEEVYGGTLILDDTIFIENAEKLQGNLQTLRKFQIPFLLLVGILVITVTFLIMRSRRLELAIASSLGQKSSRVALQLFLEIGLLNLLGNALGMVLLMFITQISIKDLLELFVLLVLEGTAGIVIALKLLFRFDIMAMLTKVD